LRLFRPLPRSLTRPLSALVLLAWAAQMAALFKQAVLEAAPVSLAADLGRYGTAAQWKGIYYKGEKIGFSVSQVVPQPDGYDLQEDGRLQMQLLGVTTAAARLHTSVRVDRAFNLRSFSFSLDPGTGPLSVEGTLDGLRLTLEITTKAGSRRETRTLEERPSLSLNLSRRLAALGLEPGKTLTTPVFDPATLRNAPMSVAIEAREVLRVGGKPTPAFKVRMEFSGITSLSWVTDTGEVLREESPTGLLVIREPRETAMALAMSRAVQLDLYEAAAVVPELGKQRLDDPLSVERLELRLTGFDLSGPDAQGAGQSVVGDQLTIVDAETLPAGPAPADLADFLRPESFIESDAPEIAAEAQRALAGVSGARARAERLVRHVNALLEKRPTISLPSALEVLRTRVGDCNEHTALYVALARAAGLPARIAVGLVSMRGAFYYHAWPEVFVETAPGRGRWLPVDPTLNQFPADLTHLRIARGGLAQQTAIIGGLGRASISVFEARMRAGTAPLLVGRDNRGQAAPLDIAIPVRDGSSGRGCWSKPK
jgi:transglutaminase-like putative cysteine protease